MQINNKFKKKNEHSVLEMPAKMYMRYYIVFWIKKYSKSEKNRNKQLKRNLVKFIFPIISIYSSYNKDRLILYCSV